MRTWNLASAGLVRQWGALSHLGGFPRCWARVAPRPATRGEGGTRGAPGPRGALGALPPPCLPPAAFPSPLCPPRSRPGAPGAGRGLRGRRGREIDAAHPEFGEPDAPVDQLPDDARSRLQADLAKIGLHIVPVGINNLDDLYTEQGRDSAGNCISESTFNGGPFYMGQEFYTSDYISPDDWTQNNALSYGSANDCMARYYNDTMDQLVIDAAGTTSSTQQDQLYGQMTQMMYDNYTVAWLVVPQQFQITYQGVTGYVSNPMGAALPFVVMQNTMYAT